MDSNLQASIIEPSTALGIRAAAVLDSITRDALANRRLDTALLLAHRAVADGNRRWMKLAVESLNGAIAGADALYSTHRLELFGGLSGLGWVIEYVARQLRRLEGLPGRGERWDSRLNEDTDTALLLELQRGRWKGTCDLTSGLTGIGLYFLQRLPAGNAKSGLELVLAHLEDAALRALPFAGSPGVAAGAAGVLYLAAEAIAAGVDEQRAKRLLAKCDEALLAGCGDSARPCSWWSGELGMAAVCLQSGRGNGSGGRSRWTAQAVERCLVWMPAEGETPDTSLIKGAAGAAHLWNRIYRAGGDSRCRRASLERWERVIESYEKATPAEDAAGGEFLGGSAGIGLALSAALTPVESEWDRLLCLSPAIHSQT